VLDIASACSWLAAKFVTYSSARSASSCSM
jgi:hypothetical protein